MDIPISRFFVTLLACLVLSATYSQKMNGISVNGEQYKPNFEGFSHLANSNANWVSVQAFCFVNSPSSGVDFNRQNFWYSQTTEGIKMYIKNAKKYNFKVFLKPHTITQYEGVWSGTFGCTNKKDWKNLEETYSKYILNLAKIAQDYNVEAFSIGVEIDNFIYKRKSYFTSLINSVREIYKGKITYCANWDGIAKIPFWNQLDFIGIDSYFTISKEKTPNLADCKKKLKPIKSMLYSLSRRHKKKIVFTEFGFQSRDYTGFNPWSWEKNKQTPTNLRAQEISYKAILETFWKEDWFLGGFSWKWHLDYSKSGGNYDNSYTPQNKPAEKVISDFYLKF
ncbi:MAG: glycoside hydrolase [Flavobacteriales bacterium]